MAPDEPSAPRRRRRSPPAPPAALSSATLAELIEHERIELMQVHAMARCLNDVLLYSDDDDSSMHADVALVVARLLNESVTRLALVRTRVEQLEAAMEAAMKENAAGPASPPHQVREARASYLC